MHRKREQERGFPMYSGGSDLKAEVWVFSKVGEKSPPGRVKGPWEGCPTMLSPDSW